MLGWAQAMPKFAGDLVTYVQTFLERTYERCRTSYMEARMFLFTLSCEHVLFRELPVYFIISVLSLHLLVCTL